MRCLPKLYPPAYTPRSFYRCECDRLQLQRKPELQAEIWVIVLGKAGGFDYGPVRGQEIGSREEPKRLARETCMHGLTTILGRSNKPDETQV